MYATMDLIKEELSGYAMELAPSDLPPNSQVCFSCLLIEAMGWPVMIFLLPFARSYVSQDKSGLFKLALEVNAPLCK
jgi:hypothetical protein